MRGFRKSIRKTGSRPCEAVFRILFGYFWGEPEKYATPLARLVFRILSGYFKSIRKTSLARGVEYFPVPSKGNSEVGAENYLLTSYLWGLTI